MGIQERKEREKEHRKEEIVDAAEKLFFEKGLQAATVDEIAEAAELSKGTIYLYYKSKEDLYLAVMMRGLGILYDMFKAKTQVDLDVVEQLKVFQETYLEFFEKHRQYFRMMHFLQAPQFHKQVSDEMMQECSLENLKIWNIATALLERGIKEGILIPNLNAVEIVIILWSSATQLLMRIDMERDRWIEKMNVDLRRVLRISNSLILGSLLTPEAKQTHAELLNPFVPELVELRDRFHLPVTEENQMRLRIHALLAFYAVSFLFADRVLAQASASTPLTLEKAVQLAVRNNPDLRTSRLEQEKAGGRVLEAWGSALPSVDLSSQYVHLIDKPVSYFPDYLIYPLYKIMDSTARFPKATGQLILLPGSMSPGFTAGASLTVRQILFNGAVIVGVGAAKTYSNLASELYRAKTVETVAKVKKVYYGALLAREVLELTQSSLKNAEDNLKNVRLLKSQGIISEYDELRATVGVENVRPMVIQAENGFELALDGLRNTIGMVETEALSLVDSLSFQAVDDLIIANADNIVLESNPGLRAVQRQIELNGAAVSAERSSYLPTILAFGSYQYQGIKNEFNFSTNDFYKSSQVGLSLSLNLFQGLQTYARVEQAQLEQQKSEEQKIALERNLKTGVHSVKNNLQQARKRLEVQDKTIELASRGYKIVTTRFLSSAATQLEVNDAELALTQAKVNRVQAVYDYLVAAADLDQLIGRLPAYVGESKQE